MRQINLTTATRYGLNFLALLGVVILLRLGEEFFIPFVIAVLLAAVLYPTVNWLNRRLHIPWSLACMSAVLGLVLLNLFVTFGFSASIPRMVQDLPDLRDYPGQAKLYKTIRGQVKRVMPAAIDDEYWPDEAGDSRIFNYVTETLKGPRVADLVVRIVWYGNNWIWQWVLIMFILLFLLLEGRMLLRRMVEIAGPSKALQATASAALSDMAHQVRNYLLWRTIINVGLAMIVGGVYQALGLRQPWTWALLTAVLCYVPYLGPIIAGIPAVLDAFLSCPSPWYALAVLLFYIGMITIEGYLVVPVVMGRSMELNATTVMAACLFWELVWGLPGLFMAMPLMAAIKAICWHIPDLRPWANLMSISEHDPPEEKPRGEAAPPEPPAAKPAEPEE